MTNLLYKDFLLNKQILAVFALVLPLNMTYFAWRGTPPEVYFFFGALVAGFPAISTLIQDDKFKCAALNCSLPVDRKTIIQSKYVGAWISGAVGVGAVAVLPLIVPGSELRPWHLLQEKAGLNAFLALTLAIGGFMPFTLRFGFVGVMIVMVSLQLLGCLALLLTVALPGSPFNVGAIIRSVVGIGGAVTDRLGVTGAMILGFALLVLVNWLSYELSYRLFRSKDL